MYSRRDFLKSVAAAAPLAYAAGSTTLPSPGSSGLDHIIVVCMENRSFDHFLGWLPGANGLQAGLSYPTPTGGVQPTWYLGSDTMGCAYKDPDHEWSGARIEYDGGRCDGWLLDTNNDIYCVGYYVQTDLPFLGQAAVNWTTCDNYFAAIMGPTYPNRLYLHSAATDRTTDSTSITSLPTIWDRLAAAGVSHRYYHYDTSFLNLWGLKYWSISSGISAFYTACQKGQLPAVCYVDPGFNGESSGTSNDDHPHGDIRNGDYFLNQVYTAVTSSRNWSKSVLVITFDEWGGFFDHVPPALVPDTVPGASPDAVIGGVNYYLRGFRVPCLVISPFSPRNTVVSGLYDHTSILRMIEWRWNLAPLTTRDASANNLAEILNFSSPNKVAPGYSVPGPFSVHC